MTKYILAIDQGTTSSRAIIFDKNLNVISSDQKEFNQHFPSSGWVEHDPEDIWQTTLETCHNAITRALISSSDLLSICLLYTSPSPRDFEASRMPSSA